MSDSEEREYPDENEDEVDSQPGDEGSEDEEAEENPDDLTQRLEEEERMVRM